MTGTLADLLGEGSTTSLPSDKPTKAGRPKAANAPKSTHRKGSLPDKRLKMEAYLSDHGQVFREKWEASKDRMLYHLEHCPVHTDPDGHTFECCVIQYSSGKLGGHCKHSTRKHTGNTQKNRTKTPTIRPGRRTRESRRSSNILSPNSNCSRTNLMKHTLGSTTGTIRKSTG